jgi:glycosyltransferase involved in cell wall biosynthesis
MGASVMKILHVLNELQPSGAETMLRLAAVPWRERGLELEILSVGDELGTYAGALRGAGYLIHHIPLEPVGPFLAAYRRLLRDGRYDVVHVHQERANLLLAAFARIVGRAGAIRTVHNVFAFDGRLRLERRLQRALLRGLGVIHVAIGDSVQASESRRFGNRTVRVLNTYDEDRFRLPAPGERQAARQRYGLGDSDFVVAAVGNCSRVKNHEALIRALGQPGAPRAQLLHVGLEDEAQTGERRLAEELGIGERMQFLGFVDDVASVFHAADCFVMPSLYEGVGIAALETLACGVPAVLADVPGLRDLREHVPDAWWVEPRPAPVAKALAEAAELDAEAIRIWGEAAATAVRENFGVQRHVEGYLKVYRSVASSSARKREPRRLVR